MSTTVASIGQIDALDPSICLKCRIPKRERVHMDGRVANAFDLLDSPAGTDLPPVVAIVGEDRFLKQLVVRHLQTDDPDAEFDRIENDREWRDVVDELSTASLFSAARRILVVDADDFVSTNRQSLEAFLEKGGADGSLLLDLKSLAANTRVFKLAAKLGLIVLCRAPEKSSGRSKQPDTNRLFRWLDDWALRRHGIKLSKDAAKRLDELVEWNFGRLDQELAKLALFVEPKQKVSVELVQEVVGGWRTQTTWDMLDAAAIGDAASALRQLDHLLQAGESPLALFGSTSWSLRRFGVAARLHADARKQNRTPNLPTILRDAGFFRNTQEAEAQLKQIGRTRAVQIFRWLLELDLALKGTHSSPQRSRLAFEHLFLRISQTADWRRASVDEASIKRSIRPTES